MLGNRFYSRNLRVALGKADVSICHWHAVLRDKTRTVSRSGWKCWSL